MVIDRYPRSSRRKSQISREILLPFFLLSFSSLPPLFSFLLSFSSLPPSFPSFSSLRWHNGGGGSRGGGSNGKVPGGGARGRGVCQDGQVFNARISQTVLIKNCL